MPLQKGCHPIVNCFVVSIEHEFIHGGELNDDFTTLLDQARCKAKICNKYEKWVFMGRYVLEPVCCK